MTEREMGHIGWALRCLHGNLGNRRTCDCVACQGWRRLAALKAARIAATAQREKVRRQRGRLGVG